MTVAATASRGLNVRHGRAFKERLDLVHPSDQPRPPRRGPHTAGPYLPWQNPLFGYTTSGAEIVQVRLLRLQTWRAMPALEDNAPDVRR